MLEYYSPSRYWRLKGQLLRLEGSNCQYCQKPHFPPRDICPEENCPSRKIKIFSSHMEKSGEIFNADQEASILKTTT